MSLVSKFMDAPCYVHFHGLHFYSQSSLKLYAYSNANWVGIPQTIATYRFLPLVGYFSCLYHNKKKDVISHSSTKVSLLPYLTQLLSSYGFDSSWLTWMLHRPLKLLFYCDNYSAIHITHNDIFHENTMHIKMITISLVIIPRIKIFNYTLSSQLINLLISTKPHPPNRLRDFIFKL